MPGAIAPAIGAATGSGIGAALLRLTTTAAFRGVTFEMLDAAEGNGRRIVRFLFPGVDEPAFADLGVLDGPIRVTGLIIGDDYVIRARRLRAAFRTPGPATLVHPWLGQIRVVLAGEPPEIRFSARELRAARFDATFFRVSADASLPTDPLGRLLTEADALVDAVQLQLAQALSPFTAALSLIGGANAALLQVAGVFGGLIGGPGQSVYAAACAPSLAGLGGGVVLPGATAAATPLGAQAAALLLAPPAAIAAAAIPPDSPAVAPGGGTQATVDAAGTLTSWTDITPAPDPRSAASLLLTAAASLSGASPAVAAGAQGAPLILAAEALTLAQAAATVASIAFVSQQEAITWRGELDAAFATLQEDASSVVADDPIGAAAVWRAARRMRAASLATLTALLGQLPQVETLTTTAVLPAWLIALHVAGDTPTQMLAAYLDINARNAVWHPAIVPAGGIEVLSSYAGVAAALPS